MRILVNEYLKSVVKQFVTGAEQGRPPEAEDPVFDLVLPDVMHFNRQSEELRRSAVPLNQTGLKVRNGIDTQKIEGVFIERLSEFMAQMFVSRSAVAGGGMVLTKANTFVDSNRHHDTILYARGTLRAQEWL